MLENTHDQVTQLSVNVNRLIKAMDGNGQPGFMQRLNSVENIQLTCPARENASNGNRNARASNMIAFGALLIALLAVVKDLI